MTNELLLSLMKFLYDTRPLAQFNYDWLFKYVRSKFFLSEYLAFAAGILCE